MSSSGQSITKPSMNNEKAVEWYTLYFPSGLSAESKLDGIKILLCLFFGMGHM